MIKKVWGNGKEVIIAYTREGFNGIWYAASNWPPHNSINFEKKYKEYGYKLKEGDWND